MPRRGRSARPATIQPSPVETTAMPAKAITDQSTKAFVSAWYWASA